VRKLWWPLPAFYIVTSEPLYIGKVHFNQRCILLRELLQGRGCVVDIQGFAICYCSEIIIVVTKTCQISMRQTIKEPFEGSQMVEGHIDV
jgi:hypothetical protein